MDIAVKQFEGVDVYKVQHNVANYPLSYIKYIILNIFDLLSRKMSVFN